MAKATRAELQGAVSGALEILNEAYTLESSREELAEAMGRALNALEIEDGAEDESDEGFEAESGEDDLEVDADQDDYLGD